MHVDDSGFEGRIKFVNEMPPYDLYDAVHSVLKNDMWEHALGYTKVTPDLPYDETETEVVDPVTGIVYDLLPVKYVNGTQVGKDSSYTYGEKPRQVWDHDLQDYVWTTPTGTRLEVNGAIEPELDLFLHDVYRYMGFLYPSHPDQALLLTKIEQNDYFKNAGAFIDYVPAVDFFDTVAESFGSDSNRFSLVVKARNVLDHATRRKFYGSPAGFRALGNGYFEKVSVFNVGNVLPIKETSALALTEDYVIDSLDLHFGNKFRLIDLDGVGSSLLSLKEKTIRSSVISIPGSSYTLYESGARMSSDSTMSDIEVFMTTDVDGIPVVVSGFGHLPYREVNFNRSFVQFTQETGKNVYYSSIDTKVKPTKKVGYVYPTFYEMAGEKNPYLDSSLIGPQSTNVFDSSPEAQEFKVASRVKPQDSVEAWRALLGAVVPEVVEFVADPFHECSIILSLPKTFEMYPEYNERTIVGSPGNDTVPKVSGPVDSWPEGRKFPLPLGNFLSPFDHFALKRSNDLFTVVGYTKGFVDFTVNEADPSRITWKEPLSTIGSTQNPLNPTAPYDDAVPLDGIVVKTSLGNVVLLGKTFCDTENEVPTKGKTFVTSIPSKKHDVPVDFEYDAVNGVYPALVSYRSSELLTVAYDDHLSITNSLIALLNKTRADATHSLLRDLEENEKTYDETAASAVIDALPALLRQKLRGNYATAAEAYADMAADVSTPTAVLEVVGKYVKHRRLEAFVGTPAYESYVKDRDDIASLGEELERRRENRSLLYVDDWTLAFDEGSQVVAFLESVATYSSAKADPLNPNPFNGFYPKYERSSKAKSGSVDGVFVGSVQLAQLISDDVVSPYDRNSDGEAVVVIEESPVLVGGSYYVPSISDWVYEAYRGRFPYAQKWAKSVEAYYEFNVSTQLFSKQVTYRVSAVVHADLTDGKTNLLYFIDTESLRRLQTITVGNEVYGPHIPDDTYVLSVGQDHVALTKQVDYSGDIDATFVVNKLVVPIDSAPYDFRRKLLSNGIYDPGLPGDHYLWGGSEWPSTANAVVPSLLDTMLYEPYHGREDLGIEDPFPMVTRETNYAKYLATRYMMTPAAVTFGDTVFVEQNLTRVVNGVPNRVGDVHNLCNVEWLDYLDANVPYVGKATDSVNVGASLVMQTSTSGKYSDVADVSDFTDPATEVRFLTINWSTTDSSSLVPAYAQIGSGGRSDDSVVNDLFETTKTVSLPNAYGITMYDGPIQDLVGKTAAAKEKTAYEPTTEQEQEDYRGNWVPSGDPDEEGPPVPFVKNAGNDTGFKLSRRSLYTEEDTSTAVDGEEDDRFVGVNELVFENSLSEYEVTANYAYEAKKYQKNTMCTIVNVTFIKNFVDAKKTFTREENKVFSINKVFLDEDFLAGEIEGVYDPATRKYVYSLKPYVYGGKFVAETIPFDEIDVNYVEGSSLVKWPSVATAVQYYSNYDQVRLNNVAVKNDRLSFEQRVDTYDSKSYDFESNSAVFKFTQKEKVSSVAKVVVTASSNDWMDSDVGTKLKQISTTLNGAGLVVVIASISAGSVLSVNVDKRGTGFSVGEKLSFQYNAKTFELEVVDVALEFVSSWNKKYFEFGGFWGSNGNYRYDYASNHFPQIFIENGKLRDPYVDDSGSILSVPQHTNPDAKYSFYAMTGNEKLATAQLVSNYFVESNGYYNTMLVPSSTLKERLCQRALHSLGLIQITMDDYPIDNDVLGLYDRTAQSWIDRYGTKSDITSKITSRISKIGNNYYYRDLETGSTNLPYLAPPEAEVKLVAFATQLLKNTTITTETIIWFVYSGSSECEQGGALFGIAKPGDILGLVFDDENYEYRVIKLDTNKKFSLTLPVNQFNASTFEYDLMFGKYGDTFTIDGQDHDISPISKIDTKSVMIDFAKKGALKGTLDLAIHVDPNLKARGWRLDDDGERAVQDWSWWWMSEPIDYDDRRGVMTSSYTRPVYLVEYGSWDKLEFVNRTGIPRIGEFTFAESVGNPSFAVNDDGTIDIQVIGRMKLQYETFFDDTLYDVSITVLGATVQAHTWDADGQSYAGLVYFSVFVPKLFMTEGYDFNVVGIEDHGETYEIKCYEIIKANKNISAWVVPYEGTAFPVTAVVYGTQRYSLVTPGLSQVGTIATVVLTTSWKLSRIISPTPVFVNVEKLIGVTGTEYRHQVSLIVPAVSTQLEFYLVEDVDTFVETETSGETIVEHSVKNTRPKSISDSYELYVEENKFFKNVRYVVGKYEDVYYNDKPRGQLSETQGIPFPGNMLTTDDRVLQVYPVKFRSTWERALENTLFSTYKNLKLWATGVRLDFSDDGSVYASPAEYETITSQMNPDGSATSNLSPGYDPTDGLPAYKYVVNSDGRSKASLVFAPRPALGAARFQSQTAVATELVKVWPLDENDRPIEPSSTTFAIDEYPVTIYGKPYVRKAWATYRPFVNDEGFVYFKNLLVVELSVDPRSPNVFVAYDSRAARGINLVSAGDSIVDVVAISPSKGVTNKPTFLVPDDSGVVVPDYKPGTYWTGFVVKKFGYENGWAVFGGNGGQFLLVDVPDLSGLTGYREARYVKLDLLANGYITDTDVLKSLSFSRFSNSWIASYSNRFGQDPRVVSIEFDQETSPGVVRAYFTRDGLGVDFTENQIMPFVDSDTGWVIGDEEAGHPDDRVFAYANARDLAFQGLALDGQGNVDVTSQTYDTFRDYDWDKDGTYVKGTFYMEGPYVPVNSSMTDDEAFQKLAKQRFIANGPEYTEAMLLAGSLFVYSPIDVYDDVGDYVLGVSKSNHWTRGDVPLEKALQRDKLVGMGEVSAYEYVYDALKTLRDYVADHFSSKAGGTTHTEFYDWFYAWLGGRGKLLAFSETADRFSIPDIKLEKDGNVRVYPDGDYQDPSFIFLKSQAGSANSAYFDYLQAYLKYVLSKDEVAALMGDGVKDMFFTGDSITLQTKYDDYASIKVSKTNSRASIEDSYSWQVATFPETLTFSKFVSANETRYVYFGKDTTYLTAVKGWPLYHDIKAFHPAGRFDDGESSFLFGYILVDNDVKADLDELEAQIANFPEMTSSRDLLRTVLPHDGSTVVTDKKYPAILVSTDGGANYDLVNVPANEAIGLPKIDSVTSSYKSLYANVAYKDGNELFVTVRSETEVFSEGIVFTKDNNTYVTTGSLGPRWGTIPEKGLEVAENAREEGVEIVYKDSCIVTLDKNGNYVFIQPASAFSVTEGRVESVNGNSIVISGAPEAGSGEEVRLLVSIDTVKSVDDQIEYLGNDEAYFNVLGRLRVNYLKQTTARYANRVYSRRETMRVSDREHDLDGIAAISEDVEHLVYEWSQRVNDAGEVVWDYGYMTNSSGSYVYYCTSEGYYLPLLDTDRVNNQTMFEVQLRDGLSVASSFHRAAALFGTASEIELEDETASTLLNDLVLSRRTNEIAYLKHDNINGVATMVLSGAVRLEGMVQRLNLVLGMYYDTPEDRLALSNLIVSQDGPYGSINNPYASFGHRVAAVAINTTVFLYDKMLQAFRFKTDVDANFTVATPYPTNYPIQIYPAEPMEVDDDGVIADINGYPVTSVYVPPKGYGGYDTNVSWNDTLPWIVDADAYESTILKNSIGDEVYMSNRLGDRVKAQYGSFKLETPTTFVLDHDTIGSKRAIVLENSWTKYTSNLYALDVPNISFFANRDDLSSSGATTITFYPVIDGMNVAAYGLSNSTEPCPWEIGYMNAGDFVKVDQSFEVYSFVDYPGLSWNALDYSIRFDPTVIPTYSNATIVLRVKADPTRIASFVVRIDAINTSVDYPNTGVLATPAFKLLVDRDSASAIETPRFAITTASLLVAGFSFQEDSTTATTISEKYGTFVEATRDFSGNVVVEVGNQRFERTVAFDDVGTLEAAIGVARWVVEVGNVTDVAITSYDLLVSGVEGNVVMRAPKYGTFRDMRSDLGNVIRTTKEPIYTYGGEERLKFFLTEGSRVVFEGLLSEAISSTEYDDYLEFKVLPTRGAGVSTDKMNVRDQYVEITTNDDRKRFGYDRIYFNPYGVPAPVVRIGTTVLNAANAKYFYVDEDHRTSDNQLVYECDSEGRYVGYKKVFNEIQQYVLGDEKGDLTADVTQLSDKRFNPKKSKYETCVQWFLEEFYVAGSPKPPFAQVVVVKDVYDRSSSSWKQSQEIRKWEKVSGVMELVEVPSLETYFVLAKSAKASIDKNSRVQVKDVDSFDSVNSRFKTIITLNDLEWDTRSKYGVIVKNMKTTSYRAQVTVAYETGSTRNVADPFDKDSSIVQVNEFALLDKNKRMIAYADFPPVEYRTDSQHFSVLAFVNYEPLLTSSVIQESEAVTSGKLTLRDENEWAAPLL